MSQISAVVQTTSAMAEESAATSEELSGQAQTLNHLISKFKFKNQYCNMEKSYQIPEETMIDNDEDSNKKY